MDLAGLYIKQLHTMLLIQQRGARVGLSSKEITSHREFMSRDDVLMMISDSTSHTNQMVLLRTTKYSTQIRMANQYVIPEISV